MLYFKNEVYDIVGCCMEVHNTLGRGFREIVYKDALELELIARNIPYIREPELYINYKGQILEHSFCADFIIYDNIILEAKSRSELDNQDMAQTINYLYATKLKLGLLVNFGEESLRYKRLVV